MVFMENARELIQGKNSHHFLELVRRLENLGYEVISGIHTLTRFGLPQIRERVLVIASRIGPGEVWRISGRDGRLIQRR